MASCGLLVLAGAVIDEAEILLHAEVVGYMRMEELAGIELGFELGDSKALRHDFDHAEGVPHGRFAQGETRVAAGVYDHHFGAFVGQDGSQHAAFEPRAENGYIVLLSHLKMVPFDRMFKRL